MQSLNWLKTRFMWEYVMGTKMEIKMYTETCEEGSDNMTLTWWLCWKKHKPFLVMFALLWNNLKWIKIGQWLSENTCSVSVQNNIKIGVITFSSLITTHLVGPSVISLIFFGPRSDYSIFFHMWLTQFEIKLLSVFLLLAFQFHSTFNWYNNQFRKHLMKWLLTSSEGLFDAGFWLEGLFDIGFWFRVSESYFKLCLDNRLKYFWIFRSVSRWNRKY